MKAKGPGTIFLVGGINDVWLVRVGWGHGLTRAALPHQIEHFRWQQGVIASMTFADLWRTEHHKQSGARLASMIVSAQQQHGGPVHVMAHSAGTAITTYALEQLPAEHPVVSAVFVGSALSPTYDLSRAMSRCRAGILSVESWLDCVFLGIGTCMLGSCDRRFGPAAGMTGFVKECPGLHRLRWHPRFVRQGWVGGHITQASPWFIEKTIAAWIRQAEASVEPGFGKGLRANIHSSTG